MCIMKIHALSHSGNAIQAMGHNSDTLTRDLRQLERLLSARGDYQGASSIASQRRAMAAIAEGVWALWQQHVSKEGDPTKDQPIGEEAENIMEQSIANDHSDILGEPLTDEEVKEEVNEFEHMHTHETRTYDEANDVEKVAYEDQVVRDA